MSNTTKDKHLLLPKLVNHLITSEVFVQIFKASFGVRTLFIQSSILLLIIPISVLLGFISLRLGLFIKLGLWSFSVMYASVVLVVVILSSISRDFAICLASKFIS